MPEPVVVVGGTASCPHFGVANVQATQTRVLVRGAAVVLVNDPALVKGCPFQIPVPGGTKPSPCGRVSWAKPAVRVTHFGIPIVIQSSSGVCFSPEQAPQGAPTITFTPAAVPPGVVLAT